MPVLEYPFGIGDVVRAKGGSKTMLVVDVHRSGTVVCAWPQGELTYAVSALRLVMKAPIK